MSNQFLEIKYKGRIIYYKSPLGIYIDGEITKRVHDAIIPKYHEIDPNKLASSNKMVIEQVRTDAERQLQNISEKDNVEVRQAIRNTLDLTIKLLEIR